MPFDLLVRSVELVLVEDDPLEVYPAEPGRVDVEPALGDLAEAQVQEPHGVRPAGGAAGFLDAPPVELIADFPDVAHLANLTGALTTAVETFGHRCTSFRRR